MYDNRAYEGMLGNLFGSYISPNPEMVRRGFEPIAENGWNRQSMGQVLMNMLRNNPMYQEYLRRDAMKYGIDYPRENSFNMY